ncbi:hypothetical protein [Streptantibioticus cattleyicolor]|uniref:Uncharacterized protein n=1 Tax=Streptantibioticus cattleyicolor (strain ATCC 35852 / DSM 46488 / JCM 4925 / NBRC 14057 / NRRL 8057) TaxID=1003195 RepID=G8X1X4_STREN|nr:hypothetical protein [Streptantibioticus cattleyicolor]AEW93298.1 hypothetical protein SCATT_09270 [Streptantibioticus cattleyicolor NRRL 8057 = DSM 46488]
MVERPVVERPVIAAGDAATGTEPALPDEAGPEPDSGAVPPQEAADAPAGLADSDDPAVAALADPAAAPASAALAGSGLPIPELTDPAAQLAEPVPPELADEVGPERVEPTEPGVDRD